MKHIDELTGTRIRQAMPVLKTGVKYLLMILAVTLAALGIAALGMRYQQQTQALQTWMYETRYVWLAWRVVLYGAIGWGIWRSYHAPGCSQPLRRSLVRIAIASVVFVAVCEMAQFSARG